MVEDGAADDAAADDHRACTLRNHAPSIPAFARIWPSAAYSSACSRRFRSCATAERGRAAARRAHEHELQGHDRDRLPTSSGSRARTRACSRSTARTSSTTRSRRRRSASALRVVAYAARARRPRDRVPRGRGDDAARTCAAATGCTSSRDACRRLHGARRFLRRLRHVRDPARATSRSCKSAASACRTAISSSSRRCARSRKRCAFAPRATVPCNNDLLAENFIDVGGEIRLIDYEYSGNNDACFELGNVWSESNLSLEQLERARRRATTAHRCGARSREPGCGASCRSTAGRCGARSRTASPSSTSTSGRWAIEKYERAVAEFDGPDFERLLDDVQRDD